ncbi:MAG: hypothetical protein AAF525_04785 [Pseudomonadota bacterium]
MTPWLSPDVQSFVQGLTLLVVLVVTYPLAFRPRWQQTLLRFWYGATTLGGSLLLASMIALIAGQPPSVIASLAIPGLALSVCYALTLMRILRQIQRLHVTALRHAHLRAHQQDDTESSTG